MSKSILQDSNFEQCTSCGDVFKIFEYEGNIRSYSIYKICNLHNFVGWSYIMKLEDDVFPIPLTEQEVSTFLENPEEGEVLALNTWFDRYR